MKYPSYSFTFYIPYSYRNASTGLEVIFDILKIIRDHRNSIKPTPLLRYSNLSSSSFSEYYNELKNKGMIKEVIDDNGKKYITLTDKGFAYLEKYALILGFIREFEL